MSSIGQAALTPITTLPGHGWGNLALKDETQQFSGAFKYRGTSHRVTGLAPGTRIVAASTGNHASGLAIAAADRDLHLTVYVPASTPQTKLNRIKGAGAQTILVDGDYDDCEAVARHNAGSTGAIFIHSFDDTEVIDGHRSLFRECEMHSGRPDIVFVPIGGGGLVTAALREWGGKVRVIGVEYEGAPAMQLSLRQGRRITLDSADGRPEGLLVRRIGQIAFETCRHHDLQVITVGDSEIQAAMRTLWHEARIRAEGAGASALAAALGRPDPDLRALCIISGGNIDPATWEHWVEGAPRTGSPARSAT